MTLQTLFPTLFGRAGAKSATPVTAPTPTVPQYRLIVLTLASQASQIDTLVRTSLHQHRLAAGSVSRTDRSGGYLLELGYVLRCQRSQRAALVHLVSVLGDTPGVRAIRWETAPHD